MPDINEQANYYDKRWSEQIYINKFNTYRLSAIIESICCLDVYKPRILDFGCGTGWLSSILNEIGPTTAIDLSEKAISNARTKYPSVQFISGSIFEVTFNKGYYDIVVSQEVIEHVEDQQKYLDLIYNYLKPNGYLILTTPNAQNIKFWNKDQLEEWEMQPIEKWLTNKDIKRMFYGQFDILYCKTIIDKFGSKGPYKIINSVKFNNMLRLFGLRKSLIRLLLLYGLGMHIIVLAKKRGH